MRSPFFFAVVMLIFGTDAIGQKFPIETVPIRYLDKQLPDFEGMTLDGDEFKLSAHRGKVLLINFWSLSCAACFKELPELNKIVSRFPQKDFLVISIMPDSKTEILKKMSGKGSKYKLSRPIAGNSNVDFMIVTDGSTIMSRFFENESVPKAFIVDKTGKLRYYSDGFLQLLYENTFVPEANYKNLSAVIDPLIDQ